MASRRSITPALCALRQAARRQQQQQQQQRGVAGLRTFGCIAAGGRRPAGQNAVAVPRQVAMTTGAGAAAAGAGAGAAALPVAARRYYSDKPADGKVWSFEDVQKVTQEANPNVVIVDVREPGELRSTGHVPGAVNIPVASQPDSFHITEEDFEDRYGYPRPPKDQEVVFYCKAGVRSRAAAGLAREAGWAKVGEYPGSWLDWAGKGGKIER